MAELKVLLTTSGIGSRLGEITNFTNKSLVRVGKKPSISYIIESYPKDTQFIITLGYFGDHVKQYIELAHPDLNVIFVEVDKYSGEGSSLLYSMLKAEEYLQDSFIFHACDSIIKYDEKIQFKNNWIGGFKKTNDSSYRSFNVCNSTINKINDKGETDYDYDYVGVCGIKDYSDFWAYANDLLNKGAQSDFEVLNQMILNKFVFNYIIFDKWLDIGNIRSLNNSRKNIEDKFEILDKKDESIFFLNDSVVKFFYDSKISENRAKRAKNLFPLVPKIIDSKKNFYKYEYSNGQILSRVVNPKIFSELLTWSDKNLWKKTDSCNL
jgi:NDP-sugar pyrophosphorylase family protein